MSFNIGNKNRFGGSQFDPFARMQHDFDAVFDPNKKAVPRTTIDASAGHKRCTVCKLPKRMAGGTNKGGKIFVCAGCK